MLYWFHVLNFADYLHWFGLDFATICQTSTLRTRTEMVFETLVCSPLNHLTRLIARENFIIPSRWESNKSHCNLACFHWSINFDHSSSNHGLLRFFSIDFYSPYRTLAFLNGLLNPQTFGRTPCLGDESNARPLPKHRTTQHRNTQTHIHARSRIRTCDLNIQAVSDSTCLIYYDLSSDILDIQWL
jgi:hypothetical protein